MFCTNPNHVRINPNVDSAKETMKRLADLHVRVGAMFGEYNIIRDGAKPERLFLASRVALACRPGSNIVPGPMPLTCSHDNVPGPCPDRVPHMRLDGGRGSLRCAVVCWYASLRGCAGLKFKLYSPPVCHRQVRF